jgi:adenylate cyclase
MALEIERKFLLRDEGWRKQVERSLAMRQAYLGGDGVSVRVRFEGDQARLNIKQLRLGLVRDEFEYAIPLVDARRLMELAAGGGTEKTRHFVRHAGMLWEIDEFHGDNQGLIVAEVELESEHQEFERPPWLGKEVTGAERYYNVALARFPYRYWPSEQEDLAEP